MDPRLKAEDDAARMSAPILEEKPSGTPTPAVIPWLDHGIHSVIAAQCAVLADQNQAAHSRQ
jgi:hypothetical protein